MTRRAGAIARQCTAAALALALSGAAMPASPSPRPATHVIVIEKMRFGALPGGLRVGDTITWVNRDLFRHSATARNGGFNVDLMPGTSASIVLRKAGTIAFYCIFHPGMRGQLVVRG